MEQITVVLENIRSAYNVGAIMRSAAAFGIEYMACIGVTPYPQKSDDPRLPHIAFRAHRAIAKTALGAEKHIAVRHFEYMDGFLEQYPGPVYAIEQAATATRLPDFTPQPKMALVIGNEVNGLSNQTLSRVAGCIEIPQETARKESLNAATACSITLYDCYVTLNN